MKNTLIGSPGNYSNDGSYVVTGSGSNYHMDNKQGYTFKEKCNIEMFLDMKTGVFKMELDGKLIGDKNLKGKKIIPVLGVYYKTTKVTLGKA